MFNVSLFDVFGIIGLVFLALCTNVALTIHKDRKRYKHIPGPKTEG